MLNAVRFGLKQQPLHLTSYSVPKSNLITNKPHIRFAQASSGPNQTEDMDSKKQSDTQYKPADTMSSFGEGYATRSDEEGFGGTLGGNEDIGGDKKENFDHSQGSEVKEKEKARHQTKVGK